MNVVQVNATLYSSKISVLLWDWPPVSRVVEAHGIWWDFPRDRTACHGITRNPVGLPVGSGGNDWVHYIPRDTVK